MSEPNKVNFRTQYPLNVHAATTTSGESGVSNSTKKLIVLVFIAAFVIFVTIMLYVAAKDTPFALLSGLVGFLVSLLGGVVVYNKLLRDKLNEDLESGTDNKVYKLFRIRLSDADNIRLDRGVTSFAYNSGLRAIALRIEIGNITKDRNAITEDFLDSLFMLTHRLNLRVKIYVTHYKWRDSQLYSNHLNRLAKVDDSKLRDTLSAIDAHQAKIFDNSRVPCINIIIRTQAKEISLLNAVINMVYEFKEESQILSTIREMYFFNKEQIVNSVSSDFLGMKMLDLNRVLSKKLITYETRRIVKVYSSRRFNPIEDIGVETNARAFRLHRKLGD